MTTTTQIYNLGGSYLWPWQEWEVSQAVQKMVAAINSGEIGGRVPEFVQVVLQPINSTVTVTLADGSTVERTIGGQAFLKGLDYGKGPVPHDQIQINTNQNARDISLAEAVVHEMTHLTFPDIHGVAQGVHDLEFYQKVAAAGAAIGVATPDADGRIARLEGTQGDDVLESRADTPLDIMFGGAGADTFVVDSEANIVVMYGDFTAENIHRMNPNLLDPTIDWSLVDVVLLNPDETDKIELRWDTPAGDLFETLNVGNHGPVNQYWTAKDYESYLTPFESFSDGTPSRGLVWSGINHDIGIGRTIQAQGHGQIDDGVPYPDLHGTDGLWAHANLGRGGWLIAGATMVGATITPAASVTRELILGSDEDDTLVSSLDYTTFVAGLGNDSFSGNGNNNSITFTNSGFRIVLDLEDDANNIFGAYSGSTTGIDHATGSSFNDKLTGNSNANTLNGSSGDDLLYGETGDDELITGGGNDTLFGGDGDDVFRVNWDFGNSLSASSSETVTIVDFDPLADTAYIDGVALSASFALAGTASTLRQDGYSTILEIDYPSPFGTITQSVVIQNFDFATWSQIGGETINGDSGNNVIDSSFVDIDGETQNDSRQTIFGGAGNDSIYDGAGSDIVFGGSGQDRFYANTGADHYDGGEGDKDEVLYINSNLGLVIDLNNSNNSTGDAAGDTFVDVERIHGTNYDDVIYLADGVDAYNARNGNDVIFDAGGLEFMKGGGGFDIFVMSAGDGQRDWILDFEIGIDMINLSAWGVMYMSEINITERTDSAGQVQSGLVVSAASGDEIMLNGYFIGDIASFTAADFGLIDDSNYPPSSDGTVSGTTGNDIINATFVDADGDSINDQGQMIEAGDGNDSVYDGEGDDIIIGGDGQDRFFANAGADHYDGGANDKDEVLYIYASSGLTIDMNTPSNSTGIAAGDTFIGIERIQSSNHDDIIYLADGVDAYNARNGNDVIHDAMGLEFMKGGNGQDTFVLVAGDGQRDRINDFILTDDLIDISAWGLDDVGDLTFTQYQNSAGQNKGLLVTAGIDELLIDNLSAADIGSLTNDHFDFV